MFVYPGDITYLVIDDLSDEDAHDEATVSSELVQSTSDWRESLLASYLVAATTSRAPATTEEPNPVPIPSPDQGTRQ